MAGYIKRVLINPRRIFSRDEFPFTLPVFKDFESVKLHPQITFLVGENGSGKSTLLEAIAVAFGFSAEGGSRGHAFATHDSHSEMHDKLLIERDDYPKDTFFLRAESFYNLSTYVERAAIEADRFPRFGMLHRRSHGESFLDVLAGLGPHGLYLMDEPESALSVTGQLALLGHVKRLLARNCQFIIATHSPIILGYGRGWIYELTASGLSRTEYEQTKPYQLTNDFLRNRGRYAEFLELGGASPD